MGPGERVQVKTAGTICWLAVIVVTIAAGPTRLLTHSFDIQAAGRMVCADGAIFVGEPTAPSSLSISLTSEIYDVPGNLVATGNAHTFTTVGETFTFNVPGTFNVGDTVRLSVTDIPGTIAGTEGDVVNATVTNCSIAAVPALPLWGLALLALALLASGAALLTRRAPERRGSPAIIR